MKRILLTIVALAIIGGLLAVGFMWQQSREAAARQKAAVRRAAEVSAAITSADAELAGIYRALQAVPTHFVNTAFFVNDLTPEQEAKPLQDDLSAARERIAEARSQLEPLASSPAISKYLAGLERLDQACVRYAQYALFAAKQGQAHSKRDLSGQVEVVGSDGYITSQESMRESMESNPDRVAGVEAISDAKALLSQARELADR